MATVAGLVLGGAPLLETIAKSTISIINLIKSYHNHNGAVITFREEIESLDGVLKEVQRVIDSNPTEAAALGSPLRQCAQACSNFEILMARCTNHFESNTTSLRDWAHVKIKEDEIVDLRAVIATSKATINIVINCINLHTTQTTAESLKTFQLKIAATIAEWQGHLERIEPRLQVFSRYETFISDEDAAERDRLQREKDGFRQCLSICDQGANEANALLQTALRAHDQPKTDDNDDFASQLRMLADLLKDNHGRLDNAASLIESKLLRVDHQLNAIKDSVDQKVSQQGNLQREMMQCCINLCAQASAKTSQKQHVLENIAAESNSVQAIVCKPGEFLDARYVKTVGGSFQVLGTPSDTTLQQMSRDRVEERRNSGNPACLVTEPDRAWDEDTPHSRASVITRTNKGLRQNRKAPASSPAGRMRLSWTKVFRWKDDNLRKTFLVESIERH